MAPIRVLIVDDHQIVREGISALLGNRGDIEILGEAEDGHEAVEKALALNPDVIIMDISLPGQNGVEATLQIKEKRPEIEIIALTMYDNDEYIVRMLKAGASGYVLKKAAASDLLRAIKAVHAGESFLQPTVASRLIGFIQREGDGDRATPLTEREQQVLTMLSRGMTTREIAKDLGLSARTVQVHRASLMSKVGARTMADLMKYAFQKGLIDLQEDNPL